VQKQLADLDAEKAKVVYEDVMSGLTEEELRQAELKLRLAEHKLRAAQKRFGDAEKSRKHTVASYERRRRRRQRRLEQTEEQIEATSIKAEVPGIVMVKSMWGRKLVAGRYVYRSQPIVSLPDLSKLKAAIWVAEEEAAHLKAGQKAHVYVPAYPNRRFLGTVHTVSRLVKEASQDLNDRERKWLPHGSDRLVRVAVEIVDPAADLRCGSTATVRILVAEPRDVVHVPRAALHTRVRVLFEADPAEAPHLTPGLAAEVSSPSLPDVTGHGVLHRVGPLVDGQVQDGGGGGGPLFGEIHLHDADARLHTGTEVVVSIAMTRPAQRHYLPGKGLRLERMHYVRVRHPSRDEERQVQAGAHNRYRVVIRSGLREGEHVVMNGAS